MDLLRLCASKVKTLQGQLLLKIIGLLSRLETAPLHSLVHWYILCLNNQTKIGILLVHRLMLKSQARIRFSLQIHIKLIVVISQVAHGVKLTLETFKLHHHLVKLKHCKPLILVTQKMYA